MGRKLWAGLDVGVETVSICVIDEAGETVHEATCPTDAKSVHLEIAFLRRRRFASVALEAGGSPTLARELRSRGYTVDLYEARKLSKFLRLRRNKTDAGDANGIAQAARLGAPLISRVHLKSLDCQMLATRLTIRRQLIRARVKATNLLCRQLELFGRRVRTRSDLKGFRKAVETEIEAAFGKGPNPCAEELHYLLEQREELYGHQRKIDLDLKHLALGDEVCGRLMTIPGVGPICALTFMSAIDEPHRFTTTSDIGSFLGLTPKLYLSGLTARFGRISKMGHTAARTALVQSSVRFMKANKHEQDYLRDWTLQTAQRRGKAKARVALARKLAVIMLSMWKTGQSYDPLQRRPVPPSPAALPELDLVAMSNAASACGSGTEASSGRKPIAFGPGGRCLFPSVRQWRTSRFPRAGTRKRHVASSNFVLTG